MKKIRIDQYLIQKGFTESRARAQALVMEGKVRLNGEIILKSSMNVPSDGNITIDHGREFVSRGGIKLDAALRSFNINVTEYICADVGASTGGFTDCLLKYGAKKVYAVDVGYGVLHWKLRQNPKVIVMERTNARFLKELPEKVNFICVDVSFISLDYLFPVLKNWLSSIGDHIITLIKPQFEAGREQAKLHAGVIKDISVHKEVLEKVISQAAIYGLHVKGLIPSPIKGPKGNIEFLADFLQCSSEPDKDQNASLVKNALANIPK